ncbi:imidazolonepropionase [Deinococcus carri]|uniref:Imidazolonepropionase n=1 Tax=Deinococcus carri TaxID=1211323 RepID=A0ABP9WCF1_9DEIO
MTASPLLALTGRLFDGEKLWPHAMVLLRGGRVLEVAEHLPLPEGTEVLDAGPEATILPGLVDLHVHARPHYARWFPEAGVTTVRDAGNSLDMLAELRALAFTGKGPHVFGAGTILDGSDSIFRHFGEGVLGEVGDRAAGAWAIHHPEEARAAVDALAAAGVETVKLYEQLPPAAYAAAVRRAQEHGLPVMTDLGTRWTRGLNGAQVDALEALGLGVRTVEHATGFALAFQRLGFDPTTQFPDEGLLDRFARAVVEAEAVLVPTLSVHEGLRQARRADLGRLPHGRRTGETADSLRAMWDGLHAATAPLQPTAAWDARLAAALTRRVLDLGGQVGAGTDTPAGVDNLPGGGLHAELEHLVTQAHLTPTEALRAATGTAGRLLAQGGQPSVGVLRPGAHADALIVEGDPARDIMATRRLRTVVRAGRVWTVGVSA